MRLYHFTNERFGLEAIRDSRFKIARIHELNDPFEFMGLDLNRDDRKPLRAWKTAMHEKYGLLCLSANWQHPLLWGHYADKHKGLCLGFEVEATVGFVPVRYRKERPTLAQISRKRLIDLDENDMKSLLFQKFEAWQYEEEYRIFRQLKGKDPASDLYFAPFSDFGVLSQVIVGAQSSVTRQRLTDVLGERASRVTRFKARPGFRRFEVVENKLATMWC